MKFALKLLIAIVLLAIIVARLDIMAVVDVLSRARLVPLLLAVCASLAIVVFDAAFWTMTMGVVGCRIAYWPAFVFSLVGWFFANLAPSTVGADLFRVAQMRRFGAPLEATLRLVVAARLMSFASLLAVIAGGLPIALRLAADPRDQLLVIGVFAAGVAALAGLLLASPLVARLHPGLRVAAVRKLADVSADLKSLLAPRIATLPGWLFLALQHLMRIATVAAIAWALDAPLKFVDLFALIPVALLVAMIPVSLGSWGVREASFIYFLGLAGTAPAVAFAISIVYGLTRMVLGAFGGAAWVFARRDHYRFEVAASRRPE